MQLRHIFAAPIRPCTGRRLLVGAITTLACVVLAGSAGAVPIRVACIGEHTTHSDSFPATNRESQPVGKQEYPAMLQTLLGPGYDVRNFGDCCASVTQGYTPSETHPYVNGSLAGRGPGYRESVAFLPDIVVIGSWGRHDWGLDKAASEHWDLAKFQADYDDLVQRYQSISSHPRVFVSLPIPITFGQADVPDNGVTTNSVLPAVNAVAATYGLPIIDLYRPFLNHRELFKEEGEHVNDNAGLRTLAEPVYAAIMADADAGALPNASSDASSARDQASTGDDTGPPSMDGATGAAGGSAGARSSTGSGGSAGSTSPPSEAGIVQNVASAPSGDVRGCACASAGRRRESVPAAVLIATAGLLLGLRGRMSRSRHRGAIGKSARFLNLL